MLLLGRTSTVTNTDVKEEGEELPMLPRCLAYMDQLLTAWWTQWNRQVFPNLVPYQKFKDAGTSRWATYAFSSTMGR